MRKLISGTGIAISAISALSAPVYAAETTASGAVKMTEHPAEAAEPNAKITPQTATSKQSDRQDAPTAQKSAGHHYKMTDRHHVKWDGSAKKETKSEIKADTSTSHTPIHMK